MSKFDFPKLKGDSNYSVWATRAEAYLIREGLINSLDDIVTVPDDSSDDTDAVSLIAVIPIGARKSLDNKGLAAIKLIVEDGPLNHIKRISSLGEAWLTLKNLYDREGFSSTFILMKNFIGLKCRHQKINEFLNSVKEIINELDSKGIKLPDAFVNAWVLESLDKSYNDFKTAIYANFRNNEKAYTLESLSSNILDEFRRRKNSKESSSSDSDEKAMVASKKPWKKTKGRYCKHCSTPGHTPAVCWRLHPELNPFKVVKNTRLFGSKKTSNPKSKNSSNSTSKSNSKRKEREKRELALIAAVRNLGVVEIDSSDSDSESDKKSEKSNLMDMDITPEDREGDLLEVCHITLENEDQLSDFFKDIS
jgi:hypothetical protein